MSDLISRSALLKRVESVNGIIVAGPFGDGIEFGIDTAKEWITEAPAVDAVPVVHGRWIEKKRWSMGKWQKWLECSGCGHQDHNLNMYEDMPFTAQSNYCPNCGTKMDGGNDG